MASLLLSGNTLFGTTPGGFSSQGTLFEINTDGSDYAGIYSFDGTNGGFPSASLILVGDTLYGTTESGGTATNGTVFAINTNGSGYRVVYSFSALDPSSDNNDGANPVASLVWSGQMLYGTTQNGGTQGFGTIFAVTTNGSFFTNLYNFTDGNDGASPKAGLVLSTNVLYGTTSMGGSNFNGTVFSIPVAGGPLSTLYSFQGTSDGSAPVANLVLAGNTLCGTASSGGSNFAGTVFALKTDGSSFTNLHSFGGTGDGASPQSGLVLVGQTLYGTTSLGGQTNNGTLFAIKTDGSGYTNFYSFSALDTNFVNSDGTMPVAGLVASGNQLFGLAQQGGAQDSGTIFAFTPGANGSGFQTLLSFDPYVSGITFQGNQDGAAPQGGIVLAGGTLYGTAAQGGSWGGGTIFAMETSGSNFNVLHNFESQADGSSPVANLILSGTSLYGTAQYGGQFGNGTVYSIGTNGSNFTIIYNFSSLSFASFPQTNSDGANPAAGLVLVNNVLYGTTFKGGDFGNGSVFALTTDGLHFTNLHSFSALSGTSANSDGANPAAGLVLSNGVLYGTARNGGTSSSGTLFAVRTDGSGFTNLYNFTNGVDGANPSSPLLLTNGLLYGTTPYAGSVGAGTLFSIGLDGSKFSVVHSFTGQGDGTSPAGGPVGDALFVPMSFGGASSAGAIFTMNIDGTGMLGISVPGGASGSDLNGQLALSADGTILAAARQGGAGNSGAIVAIQKGPLLSATLSNSNQNVTVPEGGSGEIETPVNGRFSYTVVVGSNSNPSSLSISGPLPAGLNLPSQNTTTGQWTLSGDFAQAGLFQVTLEAQDGSSAFFYTLNIDICTPPTVTNVVRANPIALLHAGDKIIITGTGLSSVTQMFFNYPVPGYTNGIAGANLVVNSDHQITVTVPTGATTGPIAVFGQCTSYITVPAVIIGSPPLITLTSPSVLPGNPGVILVANLTGPMGTYQILTSLDLVHWTPAHTVLLDGGAIGQLINSPKQGFMRIVLLAFPD